MTNFAELRKRKEKLEKELKEIDAEISDAKINANINFIHNFIDSILTLEESDCIREFRIDLGRQSGHTTAIKKFMENAPDDVFLFLDSHNRHEYEDVPSEKKFITNTARGANVKIAIIDASHGCLEEVISTLRSTLRSPNLNRIIIIIG